jgi:release factor glutamine methyltransferase
LTEQLKNSVSNVRDAVLWAASFLNKKGIDNGRLEAELLMARAMGKNRAAVLACFPEEVPQAVFHKFRQLVERRGRHFPLQYLTGIQDFMSLPFYVEEGVLVPREDTEVLVETILQLGRSFENILEVGTGSGIIAVSLAKYISEVKITATDISGKALEVARKNAEALGVQERIRFIQADVFRWTPAEKYDLIVSNPPYISREEMRGLQKEVLFEPVEALDGGERGLDFYFRLAELAKEYLVPSGILAVEIGYRQALEVRGIFERAGLTGIEVIQDYAGRDRVVLCKKGKECNCEE